MEPTTSKSLLTDDDDYWLYYDEEQEREIQASFVKARPVNIAWGTVIALGLLAILWAVVAASINFRKLTAKDIPSIGLLIANAMVLLIVEVPDLAYFTQGHEIHNSITSYAYNIATNLPLYNLVWMSLQSLLANTKPELVTVPISIILGIITWMVNVALSIMFSLLISSIPEDENYARQYVPLFTTSFFILKVIPLLVAITTSIFILYKLKCKSTTHNYVYDLVAIVAYLITWTPEDIHIMIYLFAGILMNGMELYHLAIYNLVETTGILVALVLIILGNASFHLKNNWKTTDKSNRFPSLEERLLENGMNDSDIE